MKINKANKERTAQIEKWNNRPMSWSQVSSWEYNPRGWFNKYISGIKEPSNPAMEFGNLVGDTLGLPTSMVPLLNPHLVGIKEYELSPSLGKIKLTGFCDHYCPKVLTLNENKTSQNTKKWNQKSVNEHGQLTLYSLMIYLQNGTKPEDLTIKLNYIPVAQGQDFHIYLPDPDTFHIYPTKRTTQEALQFGADLIKLRKTMEDYALIQD